MNRIFLTLFFSLFILNVFAQVTIGSEIEPLEGALLDLKQGNPGYLSGGVGNETATKGFALPRVNLQAKQSLEPLATDSPENKKSHIGLTVYNLNNVSGTTQIGSLKKGLNVWDGEEWALVGGTSAPNFMYMPRFRLELGTVGTFYEIDLYGEYYRQFSPQPDNPNYYSGSGITVQIAEVYDRHDLYYAVLDYDTSVITVIGIDEDGFLSYTVNSTTASAESYITIVLVVKE